MWVGGLNFSFLSDNSPTAQDRQGLQLAVCCQLQLLQNIAGILGILEESPKQLRLDSCFVYDVSMRRCCCCLWLCCSLTFSVVGLLSPGNLCDEASELQDFEDIPGLQTRGCIRGPLALGFLTLLAS